MFLFSCHGFSSKRDLLGSISSTTVTCSRSYQSKAKEGEPLVPTPMLLSWSINDMHESRKFYHSFDHFFFFISFLVDEEREDVNITISCPS